jgi:formylglycine-generating enzyme required for sulfatase activity
MTNKIKIFTAAVALLMMAASCSKDDAPAAPTLSLTPAGQTAIAFAADGTTADNAVFGVTTNQSAWNAVSSQTWCIVTKTAAGFTVSATPNTAATAPAPATVTVTAGTVTPIVINVTQEADAPTLSLTPAGQTTVAFAADGTTEDNAAFSVLTNQSAWDAVSSQTWCIVTKTETGFTVSATANTAFVPAEPATVTVTAGEATPVVINVTQEADAPALSLTPAGQTAIVFAADGTTEDNATFSVITNQSAWDAVSSQAWCIVTKTETGFTVSAEANTVVTNHAPATVTVTAGTATPVVINVTQASAVGMVFVQGGTFVMGCTSEQSNCRPYESPVHNVTLSSFYIGKYEVTQAEWEAVMGYNPSSSSYGPNYPVERVSWSDAQAFITALNTATGLNYRLPTEAEWEYAARGGAQSEGYRHSGSDNIGDVAWYGGNSGYTTHLVGSKQPNELGIYDMNGNVEEWCSDLYYNYTGEDQTNPTGPESGGDNRMIRGGSMYNDETICRITFRSWTNYFNFGDDIGFRLVLSAE